MAGAADWALTDAIRDRIFKRLALPAARGLDMAEMALDHHPQSDSFKAELLHGDEEATRLTGDPIVTVTACALETDTDKEGIVWCRCVDGTPNTINCYKDQGRTTLVASGTAADGATASITPQTGYTFAASIPIGVVAADFVFALRVSVPFYRQVDQDFDGSEEDDAQNAAVIKAAATSARSLMLQAAAQMAAGARAVMLSTFRRRLVSRSSETVLIAPNLSFIGDSGAVQEAPVGLLEDLVLAMVANSAGSAEMKAGAATQSTAQVLATGTNVTFSTVTLGKRAVLAVVSLVCVKDLDTTDPEFDVFVDQVDTRRKPSDGQATTKATLRLRIGKTYKWPEIGIESLLVDYTPSVANTVGTALSTTAADWVRPSGLQAGLSTSGVLYARYNAADTRLEFYSTSAGRAASDADKLVTYATMGTGNVNATFITEDIGNGLILAGKTGAGTTGALVDGDMGTVSYQVPIAVQPSSRATITISETVRRSLWLKIVSDGFIGGSPGTPTQTAAGWELNTGSAPNIDPAWLRCRTLTQHKRVANRRG
jgi:hypothetical protein